jgi:DNA-binding NtrC family response regulator
MLLAFASSAATTKPATEVSAFEGAQAEMTDSPGKTGESILVVDDVADILVTLAGFLAKAGFTVEKAASGDEALRKIVADPRIDTLVTDLAMPGLSGAALIARAKHVRPNLKTLVITGSPSTELPPYTPILVKPFRRATLIAKVKSLLGNEAGPEPNGGIDRSVPGGKR